MLLPARLPAVLLLATTMFVGAVSYDGYIAANCPSNYANGKNTALWYYRDIRDRRSDTQPDDKADLGETFTWEDISDHPMPFTSGDTPRLSLYREAHGSTAGEFVGKLGLTSGEYYPCRRSDAGSFVGDIAGVGCFNLYQCKPWNVNSVPQIQLSEKTVDLSEVPSGDVLWAHADRIGPNKLDTIYSARAWDGERFGLSSDLVMSGGWRGYEGIDRDFLVRTVMNTWDKFAVWHRDVCHTTTVACGIPTALPCYVRQCDASYVTLPAHVRVKLTDPEENDREVGLLEVRFTTNANNGDTESCEKLLAGVSAAGTLVGAFYPPFGVFGGIAGSAAVFCADI